MPCWRANGTAGCRVSEPPIHCRGIRVLKTNRTKKKIELERTLYYTRNGESDLWNEKPPKGPVNNLPTLFFSMEPVLFRLFAGPQNLHVHNASEKIVFCFITILFYFFFFLTRTRSWLDATAQNGYSGKTFEN